MLQRAGIHGPEYLVRRSLDSYSDSSLVLLARERRARADHLQIPMFSGTFRARLASLRVRTKVVHHPNDGGRVVDDYLLAYVGFWRLPSCNGFCAVIQLLLLIIYALPK